MMLSKIKFFLEMTLIGALIQGCTSNCSGERKDMSPEQVVEAYLTIAMNMTEVSEKSDLLLYTIGSLRDAIDSANDDTIKANFIDKHYNLKRFTLVERRDITPREVEITFQLEYHELEEKTSKVDEAPLVTTENTVSVIRKQGYWFIRDVIGAKTTIDFALSSENDIKSRPTDNTPDIEYPEE